MKATEMLELLREFHRDKLLERARHVASARVVADYDFNNTYQYVVAREDMHVRWLGDAILDLKGQLDESVPQDSERSGKGAAASEARSRAIGIPRSASSTSGVPASTRFRTRATGPCST